MDKVSRLEFVTNKVLGPTSALLSTVSVTRMPFRMGIESIVKPPPEIVAFDP